MASDPEAPAPSPSVGGWACSIGLGVVLASLYMINRVNAIGTEDSAPAQLLAMAIVRGDGPYLDRFRPILTMPGIEMSWAMRSSRGHIVSRYPIGTALVLSPLVAAQVPIFDRLEPGWQQSLGMTYILADQLTKNACAMVVAITAVGLHRLLRRLGLGRVAIPATLAAAVGSDLWVVGSQAPWQHGPAALAITTAMLLFTPRQGSRPRLVLAGLAAGVLIAIRPQDAIFAAAMLLAVAVDRPRNLVRFAPGLVGVGAAVVAYNVYFFGNVLGGQAELESLHPTLHGVDGPWSGRLLEGLAGTLFSPNRGLFVFSPWAAIGLATLPACWRRLRSLPLGLWLLGALAVEALLLSKYAVWWAGHSFGPRYWTESMPIFAVLLAYGLDWARTRFVPLVWLAGLLIATSVAFQAIGAVCYPSTWNGAPADVDRNPSRLWDWSDSEISRCLREGPAPRSLFVKERLLFRAGRTGRP